MAKSSCLNRCDIFIPVQCYVIENTMDVKSASYDATKQQLKVHLERCRRLMTKILSVEILENIRICFAMFFNLPR